MPEKKTGTSKRPVTKDDEPEEEEDEEGQEERQEATGRPRGKTSGRAGRVSSVRGRAQGTADDYRLRVIAFNSTAALPGLALGLGPIFGDLLTTAEQSASGILAAALAVFAGGVGLQVVRQPAVRVVLFHPVLQLAAIGGTAELGRRSAPLAVTWLTENATPWGLPPSAVALLMTVIGMCGGLYWLIDRPARGLHWVPRLIVRIPLASALLATALHTSGATTGITS